MASMILEYVASDKQGSLTVNLLPARIIFVSVSFTSLSRGSEFRKALNCHSLAISELKLFTEGPGPTFLKLLSIGIYALRSRDSSNCVSDDHN
ncbi:hypothetical protein ACTXT7_000172 [Hymenolepis weldensis]